MTSVVDQIFETNTKSDKDAMAGGDLFERHRVTVAVPAHYTTLELPDDMEELRITLQELTAEEEAQAAQHATSQGAVGHAMAQRSLYAMEGEPLGRVRREWLWGRLGMRGRQLVAMTFASHFTADEEVVVAALKKAEVG